MSSQCKWNTSGTVLALAGAPQNSETGKDFSLVNFYDAYGSFIRSLRVRHYTGSPPSMHIHAAVAERVWPCAGTWAYRDCAFVGRHGPPHCAGE
jgi:hypothetical protein